MPVFRLEHLRTDEDAVAHMVFSAASRDVSATVEFYCYTAELRNFAHALQRFPDGRDRVVAYEYGVEKDWATHLSSGRNC